MAWPFQASVHDLSLLFGLGLGQLAIPCVLVVVCARVLKAPEVALLGLLEIIFGILLVWLGALTWFREPVRRLHRRWFRLSDELFDAMHYGAMAAFKLLIIVFNLTPLLAIKLLD